MTATSTSDRKLRWAILGTSFISGVIAKAILESTEGEIYCIAGRTEEKVASFATEHGIAVTYTDYADVLNDKNVEVVYIGLPTKVHAQFVKLCAIAGKHVLCEKSFSVNAREAVDAIDVVKRSNIFMMEAQMYRCHPMLPVLKELVTKSKPLGNIVSIDANFFAPIIDLFNREAGGSILDLGCYPVSLARYLCGRFVNVSGSANLVPPERAGHNSFDSYAEALVTFEGGVTAAIRASNNVDPLVWSFVITCESGSIELSNLWDETISEHFITLKPDDQTAETRIGIPSDRNFYTLQIDTVNSHIIRGDVEATPPAMTWLDTIENMVLLDAWRNVVGLRYPADEVA